MAFSKYINSISHRPRLCHRHYLGLSPSHPSLMGLCIGIALSVPIPPRDILPLRSPPAVQTTYTFPHYQTASSHVVCTSSTLPRTLFALTSSPSSFSSQSISFWKAIPIQFSIYVLMNLPRTGLMRIPRIRYSFRHILSRLSTRRSLTSQQLRICTL